MSLSLRTAAVVPLVVAGCLSAEPPLAASAGSGSDAGTAGSTNAVTSSASTASGSGSGGDTTSAADTTTGEPPGNAVTIGQWNLNWFGSTQYGP